MYQFIPLQRDYLCEPLLKANVATDEGKDQNETWTLKKEMNLEWLCKVGPKSVLNSWPDSSVGQSIWTQFSGHGFKSQSGQLSIATSKNPSVVNTIYTYMYIYILKFPCKTYIFLMFYGRILILYTIIVVIW